MSTLALNRTVQWATVLRTHAEIAAVTLAIVTETILAVYRGGAAL